MEKEKERRKEKEAADAAGANAAADAKAPEPPKMCAQHSMYVSVTGVLVSQAADSMREADGLSACVCL